MSIVFHNMNTLELKDLLISRIAEIDDVRFLKAIKTILDAKTESQTLSLSRVQKQEIEASRKDINQGLFINQTDLDIEIAEWLKEK